LKIAFHNPIQVYCSFILIPNFQKNWGKTPTVFSTELQQFSDKAKENNLKGIPIDYSLVCDKSDYSN